MGTQVNNKREEDTIFVPENVSEIVGAAERTKLKGYEFGWIYQDELDKILSEITGIENATSLNLMYAIKGKVNTYLVDTDFNVASKSYMEKGTPVKYYDSVTEELLGFVFLDDDILDDVLLIEDDSNLDELYQVSVESQEDDINFQLMVKTIM